MRHIIAEYISKNGIQFHHSVSTQDAMGLDVLKPETHDMYEIILLLNGKVQYNIEGLRFHPSVSDVLLIPPNTLHTRDIDASVPYERMVLHFAPDLLPSFADLHWLSNYQDAILPAVLPERVIKQSNFIHLMQQCERLCKEENKYTDLRFVRVILQIVETLNETITKLDENNMLPPIRVDHISHRCIQYIHQHLTDKDKVTPQRIAEELHISPSHLQHTFKKELGISLHAYVFNQRMQLAKQRLLQGHSPQSVANMLGYEYYSTFYHGFVRQFHLAPHLFQETVQARENSQK